jgi:NAD(P)-dependent dehydrogenase (short-subunit alcohol dehydrogenase family)
MRDLKGKVAVVTGAASGIGRAMAARFASEGMRVVLADVQEDALARAHEDIARGGADAIAVPADVSKWEAVEALARRTFEAFGTAHVVCNNAGVGAGGFAWEMPEADWSWVLGVNLWSVIHGVRAFVPRMIEQREGHVVNTASMAGLITTPGMSAYSATKHAVVALSECLHHDLAAAGHGDKVRVSAVCPGWVKTNVADAGRNRPASAPRPQRSPQSEAIDGMFRAAVAAGIPAEDVAGQVLDAIVNERFWVLTHPKMGKSIERRMRGILEGKNPEFDPSRM